jgi:chromosome segregation ATPase
MHHVPTYVLPGVIDRWELLQAQALSKELRMKQNLQKWQQFNSDLNNIWAWLGETEEELDQLQRLELSTDIQTIERQIKKLKVAFPCAHQPIRKPPHVTSLQNFYF